MPVFTELKQLTIIVKVTIATHLVHHEIFLVFQLAEHHCKEGKKLRQTIDMHIVREIAIKDLVVRPMQVVTLKDVNYFEHEHTAGFRINPLLLYLIV